MSCLLSTFNSQTRRVLHAPKLPVWLAGLIMLFLLSQTAGLLHAEIHPFHSHVGSCELFEQLAQPISTGQSYAFSFVKPAAIIPINFV